MLAHALVTAPDTTPDAWMLFLHGIFGTGSNWRTFARKLVAARPRWGAALVDLRMHGASQGLAPPHTLARAAEDLRALEAALPGPVEAVVGHSFGGKVALEYLAQRGGALDVAWVLDSAPGARTDARGSETTAAVLALLESMGPTVPSREAFVAHIEAAGYGRGIAQWLAMNLKREGEAYALRVELGAIRALLEDYFAQDLWRVVEQPPGRARLHVVVGGRSPVFDPEDRARLARWAAASGGRLTVHTLPEAGHWVHVDAPDALFAAVLAGTPEAPRGAPSLST